MKCYAAINDDYLGKSIRDGSLAIFEEKEDAERVCSKMDYDLIEVSVVNHETYSRLTKENAKLREALEGLIESASVNEEQLNDLLMCGDYGESKELCDAKQLLNQLKDQNNDK